jgi:hypothetical protein
VPLAVERFRFCIDPPRRELKGAPTARFSTNGGGVVAHLAGHNLDGNIQRLLHRTAGDCGMAFQHIE